MIDWIAVLLGSVTGAIIVLVFHFVSLKPKYIVSPAAKFIQDKTPVDIFGQIYGCERDNIVVRPLIPVDFNKTSWVWKDNDEIRVSGHQLIELTGVDCVEWTAVSIFNNVINSVRIGLLTSWDNSASVIIKPNETVYLRMMDIDGAKREHFALKGKIYEPSGAYIK